MSLIKGRHSSQPHVEHPARPDREAVPCLCRPGTTHPEKPAGSRRLGHNLIEAPTRNSSSSALPYTTTPTRPSPNTWLPATPDSHEYVRKAVLILSTLISTQMLSLIALKSMRLQSPLGSYSSCLAWRLGSRRLSELLFHRDGPLVQAVNHDS